MSVSRLLNSPVLMRLGGRPLQALKGNLRGVKSRLDRMNARRIARKYSSFTMIPEEQFADNLLLVACVADLPGSVVECGVWRGGMSAGMAEVLGPQRHYYLFDSFEGLPEAKEIDGPAAAHWQSDPSSPFYYDNCAAEIDFAKKAMAMSPADRVTLGKGWFSDTLPNFVPEEPIALLRLDGDWYDSTMQCLVALYPHVAPGGVIIIDDYYAWEGCCKAVHDYLSANKLADRIRQTPGGVAYMVRGK